MSEPPPVVDPLLRPGPAAELLAIVRQNGEPGAVLPEVPPVAHHAARPCATSPRHARDGPPGAETRAPAHRTPPAAAPRGRHSRARRSGPAALLRAPQATRAAARKGGRRWGRTRARTIARGTGGTRRARVARTRDRSSQPAGGSGPRTRSESAPASGPPPWRSPIARPRPRVGPNAPEVRRSGCC